MNHNSNPDHIDEIGTTAYHYITRMINNGEHVKVFLGNGFCLMGKIIEQDETCIILQQSDIPITTYDRLIYKHSISNISPV